MAQESLSSKILASNNIEPTVHPSFPTNKTVYLDHSVEETIPCKIYPETTDLANGSPLEFVIHECAEQYLDLSSLKLEVKLRLLNAAGGRADINNDTEVYFTNNLLSSLFPICKVFINNTNVESQYYNHHIANLNHIMEVPISLSDNRGLPSGMFSTSDAKQAAATIVQETCENNELRKTFTKQEIILLKGFLNCDIASSNKFMIDGVNLRILLEAAKPSQIINAKDNAVAFLYEILSARLLVDRIKPTKSGFLNVSKYMQNHSMEYIFKQNIVHSELIAIGQNSLTIHRPFNSKIPSLLHIFFVEQLAEQGIYNKDRLWYGTQELSSYRITINGRVLTEDEVDPRSGYMSPYVDSLIANGCPETFINASLYNRGSFVLSVKTNSSQPEELMYETSGNLSIHLNFRNNLPSTVICFVVGVCHSSLEISPDRHCLTNFGY